MILTSRGWPEAGYYKIDPIKRDSYVDAAADDITPDDILKISDMITVEDDYSK
ncbi:hypothetical protein MUY27_08450 [Mucilaginibacter sp. RS28]|uniref:Uncharacterized protein n=1 Tax=Mucilaginibacter straminoryzae TaxID=2932774 RepID=A0A9X1X1Y0_9SPHI|nr:hypothetical protein [Mucilaginibacter straminoryzae]MCJ8209737.1 hypothetical protein [Mucilaginibacter straminoryzae]